MKNFAFDEETAVGLINIYNQCFTNIPTLWLGKYGIWYEEYGFVNMIYMYSSLIVVKHSIIGDSDVFSKIFLNVSLCAISHLIAPHFKAYSCRKTFHYIGYITCFKSIWWETEEFALIRIFERFWATMNSLFWHAISISCHTNFMLHHRVILKCKFKIWIKSYSLACT